MKNGKFSKFINKTKSWTGRHSPEILIGLGITGMVSTTVLAVKATPKALVLIEEVKEKENKDELTAMETVKVTWKCYIPAATTCVFSVACLIGANSVNSKRNAALATAYKLTENAFTEYKEKVVETIGEKKEKVVRDKVAKDKVKNNPPSSNQIIITDKGNTLCYDSISGRYFKSDIDRIKKAENELNSRLLREGYISLTDFYNEIGLTSTSVSDDLGWNTDGGLIEIMFSSQLSEEDNPCLVLDYSVTPKYDYWKFA